MIDLYSMLCRLSTPRGVRGTASSLSGDCPCANLVDRLSAMLNKHYQREIGIWRSAVRADESARDEAAQEQGEAP
jgi:hypothetical protein